MNGAGDGAIAIGLRCGLVREGRTQLFAGAGIVADSLPDAELKETRLKLRPLLDVLGRDVATERYAKGVVWFDFQDICDGPRSQQDYIEIARWYPTVIVSEVPVLDEAMEDQTRRFIALVDEFYDRRVKLIISAAAEGTDLYRGTRLEFEFDRTTSRLVEMQSAEYLAAPHLA